MLMSIYHLGPSKICGRRRLKNFTWSILEYFVPFNHVSFLVHERSYNNNKCLHVMCSNQELV